MPASSSASWMPSFTSVERRVPVAVLAGSLIAAVVVVVLIIPLIPNQDLLSNQLTEHLGLVEKSVAKLAGGPASDGNEESAVVEDLTNKTQTANEQNLNAAKDGATDHGPKEDQVMEEAGQEEALSASEDAQPKEQEPQCLELQYPNNVTKKLCREDGNQTVQLEAQEATPEKVQEVESAQLETALAEEHCITLYLPNNKTRQLCDNAESLPKDGDEHSPQPETQRNTAIPGPKIAFTVDWRGKVVLVAQYPNASSSLPLASPAPFVWNTTRPKLAPRNRPPLPKLPTTSAKQCPPWFGYILQDLAPWAEKGGVEFEALEAARPAAALRLQVLNGELFLEKFRTCPGTSAALTVWGILMLLNRFPGLVPDLDLLLACDDYPTYSEADYRDAKAPPLLLRFAGGEGYLDVPWPDFTFWGWPEQGIRPWDEVVLAKKQQVALRFLDRENKATWSGNTTLSWKGKHLVDCKERFPEVEANEGPEPPLDDTCHSRYRIWSGGPSLKYVLACRPGLVSVKQELYTFFSRGLEEGKHFTSVEPGDQLCDDVIDIVSFWNRHPEKAEAMAKANAVFVDRDLAMPSIYNYMLHFLRHYASLQKFVPTRSPESQLMTWQALANELKDKAGLTMTLERKTKEVPCVFGQNVALEFERREKKEGPLGLRPPPTPPGSLLLPPPPKSTSKKCPVWFSKMDDDLAPWRSRGGIDFTALEGARKLATHRFQIIGGQLYITRYKKSCFQSRAEFTIWGILMLLRRYPDRVPDVDFLFECWDWPVVPRLVHEQEIAPPVIFKYCSTRGHLDIPWPDFSFWGWPEVAITHWRDEVSKIFNASDHIAFLKRSPRAFWRGNANMAPARQQVLECGKQFNSTVETYMQDWEKEDHKNSQESRLENQCNNRYKIYVPGRTWSCSLKYILACKSAVLMVAADFFDFFSRGLQEGLHIGYIHSDDRMCSELDEQVKAWNEDTEKAEAVGRRLGEFVHGELSMDRVYDYMLHVLSRYAALQKFVPQVGERAQRVDMFQVLMDVSERQRKYLFVENQALDGPCEMEPPPD